MRPFFLLIAILGVLVACDNGFPRIDPENLDRTYYPMFIGLERIYSVDSIVYDVLDNRPVSSSSSFFRRELVIDSTITNIGDTLYRVERYRGESISGPWEFQDIAAVIIRVDEAIYKEDNLNYLELQFPFSEDDTWDGATYIDGSLDLIVDGELLEDVFQNWETKVVTTNASFSFDGNVLSDVAITEVSDSNAVTLRSRINHFAPGFGLVRQETRILNSICKHELSGQTQFCADLAWEEKASRGYILRFERVQ